jgi:Spy/CpxP family protein refolding chaperone
MKQFDFALLASLGALSVLTLHISPIAAVEMTPSHWQSRPSDNTSAAANSESPDISQHHGHMNPDRRLVHMTIRYKLTGEQQSQIKPILQEEQQQLKSLRTDSSASRDEKRTKMQSIRQASQEKIAAILTDSQRQEFNADEHMMEEPRHAERKHCDATPASPDTHQPPAQPQ